MSTSMKERRRMGKVRKERMQSMGGLRERGVEVGFVPERDDDGYERKNKIVEMRVQKVQKKIEERDCYLSLNRPTTTTISSRSL